MMRDSAINDLVCEFRKNLRLSDTCIKSDAPLSAAEFGQALLPHGSKSDFHFEALHQILPFWGL